MTCIVAIKSKNNVYLRGDRMGSNGFTFLQTSEPKVFKKDDFVFGVSGSFLISNALKYRFNIPKRKLDQSDLEFLHNEFIDAFIESMRRANAVRCIDGELKLDGAVLFGYKNNIYRIESNFQILSNLKIRFNSIGSGSYHSLSSLYSTEDMKMSNRDRIKKAIVCASEFVLSVDSTIDIVSLNEK